MKKPVHADFCDTDPTSVSAERAQELIREAVTPVSQIETVAVRAALGRIAALDVKSAVPVPNHTNSAMDGYALGGRDLPGMSKNSGGKKVPKKLQVIGVSMAGKPFAGKVGKGQCVRIMTGAVMPAGADSVVIQERIERHGDLITVPAGEKPGANVRRAGEDLEIGEVAIAAGRRLAPSHLGLAASLGFSELPVFRRPRVAFFSNGDELRAVGGALATGELYDSNRYTLYGMLAELGVEMVDLGIVPDDAAAVGAAFEAAAACADVVITSAGASVGEADYIRETLGPHRRSGFLQSGDQAGPADGVRQAGRPPRQFVLRPARQSGFGYGDLRDFCQAGAQATRRRGRNRTVAAHGTNHIGVEKTAGAGGISARRLNHGGRRHGGAFHRRAGVGNSKLHGRGELLHHSAHRFRRGGGGYDGRGAAFFAVRVSVVKGRPSRRRSAPVAQMGSKLNTHNRLVYVHDPMCSWCWGFAPNYRRLAEALPQSIPVVRLLGGLAPDCDEPMAEEMQRYLRATWETIEARIPGTRFNYDFWDRCRPRRSTWPACRAVIAARHQRPDYDLAMTEAIQRGYYLQAKNPSDNTTLIEIAEGLGLRTGEFETALASKAVRRELEQEIAMARQLGVRGFPALMLLNGNAARPIAVNYSDVAGMLDSINGMATAPVA